MSLCHQGQARKSGDDALLLTKYAGKRKAAVRRLSQEVTRSRGDKLRATAPDLLTREYLPGSLSPPKYPLDFGAVRPAAGTKARAPGSGAPFRGTFVSPARLLNHERTGKYQNHRAIRVGDLYHDADAQRLRLLISFPKSGPNLFLRIRLSSWLLW